MRFFLGMGHKEGEKGGKSEKGKIISDFGFRIVKLSCCDLSVAPPRADPLSVAAKTKGIGEGREKREKRERRERV